jgi:hypothetical protein
MKRKSSFLTATTLILLALFSNSSWTFSAQPVAKVQQQSLRVVSTILSASPEAYDGQCPITIKFSGSITVKGKGRVKYSFVRSDGATGPVFTLDFNGETSKSVSTTWTLSAPTFNEWLAVRIFSPNKLESNRASFKGMCRKSSSSNELTKVSESSQQQAKSATDVPVPDLKPNPSPDVEAKPLVEFQRTPEVKTVSGLPPHRPPDVTLLPDSVRQAPHVISLADTPGWNWDFEEGLAGWTPAGEAFADQPTLGDNVAAARVRTDMALERGGIGGDYWKRVPYPIGHHLNAWVGDVRRCSV